MDIECNKHGLTGHYKRADRENGWRCRKCNKERQRVFKTKRKDFLLNMAGGKCIKCGYNKCKDALHFHHLRDKSFELSKRTLAKKTEKEVLEEFKKCILVCANCHAEIHHAELN